MTSRTTKQAAREYQKAHGVPYTEALRRVIGGQAPGEADAGVGASSKRTVWLDPLNDLVESLDRQAGVPVETVDLSGPGQEGPLVFELGAGLLPDTGFTPAMVPARWIPMEEVRRDHPATLGVHGVPGSGKSVYLATLARNHLEGVPTVLVTDHPGGFPDQEGLTSVDPALMVAYGQNDPSTAEGEDAASTLQEAVEAALSSTGAHVVVYDLSARSLSEDSVLQKLLRTSRSRGLVVLYSVMESRRSAAAPLVSSFEQATVVVNPHSLSPFERSEQYDGSWVCKAGHEQMPLILPGPYLPGQVQQG